MFSQHKATFFRSFFPPKLYQKRGLHPNLSLWHHKIRKNHQHDPKVTPTGTPTLPKTDKKTTNDPQTSPLVSKGHPEPTKWTPRPPKWSPRVPKIEVLGAKSGKNTVKKRRGVCPFRWSTRRMNQCISEPMNQWINESMKHESMNQWLNESVNQRINESTNPWITSSVNPWIDESMPGTVAGLPAGLLDKKRKGKHWFGTRHVSKSYRSRI